MHPVVPRLDVLVLPTSQVYIYLREWKLIGCASWCITSSSPLFVSIYVLVVVLTPISFAHFPFPFLCSPYALEYSVMQRQMGVLLS